jgi:hypothetical protein
MTDYTAASGTGELLLRDTGSTVEFYFKAGYSSDWYNGLAFNWTANGSTTSKTIDYPSGGAWYLVGSVNVATTQTVTFRLTTSTGVSGMGGPSAVSAYLNRSGPPGAPSKPAISTVLASSVLVKFSDGTNGGLSIDSRQIAYSLSTTATNWVSSNGSTTVSGLTPGKTYNFWARCHNADGWGPYSAMSTVTLPNVPTAPSQPLLASATETTMDISWSPSSGNGSTVTGYQVGYGTSTSGPTTIVSASSPQTITGLSPGTLYYFWVRAQNSVGYSAWSQYNSASTVAGAYIFVESTLHPMWVGIGGAPIIGGWHPAVPYVRVGGVWKPAEVWINVQGVWTRTTNT